MRNFPCPARGGFLVSPIFPAIPKGNRLPRVSATREDHGGAERSARSLAIESLDGPHFSRNRDRAGWRKALQQQTRRHGEFVATMTFLRAQMAWMLAPCRASDYCSHSVPILSSVITRTPAARARMWLADSNEN